MKYVIRFFILSFLLLSNIQVSVAKEICYSYKSAIVRSYGGSIQQWTGNGWMTTAISCTSAQRSMFGDSFCSSYDKILSSPRIECPDE